MHILLEGKETLEQRFDEIDSQAVRKAMEESRNEVSVMLPQIKKIIKIPQFPEVIVSLLERRVL